MKCVRGYAQERHVNDTWNERPNKHQPFVEEDTHVRPKSWREEEPCTRRTARDVLRDFLQPEAEQRLMLVREGRERRILAKDQLVIELSVLLSTEEHTFDVVEKFLDELFATPKHSERFERTEIVIAILYTLERSSHMRRREIIESFAKSQGAEVAQIARFAKRILDNGV